MRDNTVYQMYQNLAKYIQQIENSVRLGLTGEVVRAEAIQRLLIKKGLVTEAELTEAIGEVIKEVNQPKTEEVSKAPEIVPATPEQVQVVEQSAENKK